MSTCSLSSHIPVRWYNDEPASINQFCNIPVEACRLCSMWLVLPLSLFLLFVDPSTSCCCSSSWKYKLSCTPGCNFFNCNCDTMDGGYCIRRYPVTKCVSWEWTKEWKLKCTKEWSGSECKSSKGRQHAEWCPGRKRMKRSVAASISRAYGELYSQMLERPAMHHFFTFDLNRDGRISLEEAMLTTNGTKEEFNLVDEDNDGHVHPEEFDSSLLS